MKFTYTMAQIITVGALMPTWYPAFTEGWPPVDFVSYALALAMVGGPHIYNEYGPGLELR